MEREYNLVLTVCKTLVKHSQSTLQTLNSPQKRVAFLIEKLASLRIEVSNEERKQFSIFWIQLILTAPTIDAKIKKNLMLYALRNGISLLDMQNFFNELQKNPIPFPDIIAKDFFFPLINTNTKKNEKTITFNGQGEIETITAYNQELYKANFPIIEIFKSLDEQLPYHYRVFIAFCKHEIEITNNLCDIPSSVSQLFQMPTPLLTRLLTNSNLVEGASFEKWFGMIHYDSWRQSDKSESFIEFEYETPVDTIPKKPKYEFNFQNEYLPNLEQFFLSFNSAINKILKKFQQQYQEWEFIYQEAMYEKLTTMVSRWLKYAFLLFHKIDDETHYEFFSETYELVLFFLEYYKHFSGYTISTVYKHPSIKRKIGLLSFYTPFSSKVLIKKLKQAQCDEKTLNDIHSFIKNELYFEIFNYENEKDFYALINPLKSLDWGSMLAYKFLIKKITYLMDFQFWETLLPQSIKEIKNLYLSQKLSYSFIIDNHWEAKTILRCKDKEIKYHVWLKPITQEKTSGSFWEKLLWKEQKEIKQQNIQIVENHSNQETKLLEKVFSYFPLKYCKEEQQKSPYYFLRNYKNPLYSLYQFHKFHTQSYYQLLKIQQAITNIKWSIKLLYGVTLKNISTLWEGFELPYSLEKNNENRKLLTTFNQNLPKVEIQLQSLVTCDIPLDNFPTTIKKHWNYTLIYEI